MVEFVGEPQPEYRLWSYFAFVDGEHEASLLAWLTGRTSTGLEINYIYSIS